MSVDSIASPSRQTTTKKTSPSKSDDKDDIPTIKYVHSDICNKSVLTVFSSYVESLKKGIIRISKNRAIWPYTKGLLGVTYPKTE